MTLALDSRVVIYLQRLAPRYGRDRENLAAEGQYAILKAERQGDLAGDDEPARTLARIIGRRGMSHAALRAGRDAGRQRRYAAKRPKLIVPPNIELLDVPALLRQLQPDVASWVWRHYAMGETWIEIEADTGIGHDALRARCERAMATLRKSITQGR